MSDGPPNAGPSWMRHLAGASLANLGMQVASTALGLFASLTLSHLLGADGLGIYAFAFTLATFLSVVTRLGLDGLLMREVAVARSRQAFGALAGVVRWGARASGAVAVVLGLTVSGVTWLVADGPTARAVSVAMVMLLPMTWLTVPSATLRGLDRPVVANVPTLLVRPALFVAGVAVLAGLGRADPALAVGANLIAHTVALATFVVPWRRHYPREARLANPVVDPREILAMALPVMFLAGLNMVVVQADLLMLKGLSTNAAVGIYAVVAQLVRLIGMPLLVVNRVVAPRFAAAHARSDHAAMQRTAATTAAGITALTLPAAAGLMLLAAPVLSLFGEGFASGALPLQVLAAGQVFNGLCGSVGTVLLMVGRERELGVVSLASALLNVALNLVLIPRFGMLGAAMASSASLVLFNAVLVARVRLLLDLDTTLFGLWRRQEPPP